MIAVRFKPTWPLAVLILISLAAWLLRHASQAQTQTATRPINRVDIIDMPTNGQPADDPTRAARDAYGQANEFDRARERFNQRGVWRRERTANGS